MKQAKRLFVTVALALAVVATSGCSKDEESAESNGQVATSTTISLPENTKALTTEGVKTFSTGDVIAVLYEKTDGTMDKKTITLREGDITNSGKSATISLILDNPQSDGTLKIVYPAAMATDGGEVNYAALASQDGTLATISSSLDLALYEGSLSGTELPDKPNMSNPLTVCEFNIKNVDGTSDLTSSLDMLYIADGTNSYYVGDPMGASMGKTSIWVVMKPVAAGDKLVIRAKAGSDRYEREITGKTLTANNMYHINLGTKKLRDGALFGTFTIASGTKVRFSQGNLQATYDGSWTWAFATNQYDYIGNAGGNRMLTTESPYISGNGTVDLFGWVGNSLWVPDEGGMGINDSRYNADVYGNVAGESLGKDWGTLAISNGGNTENSGWHLMTGGETEGEWHHLFFTRSTSTVGGRRNGHYASATVAGHKGIIVFPDEYIHSADLTAPAKVDTADSFNNNTYDAAAWAKMEAAGAVFLPAAGARNPAWGVLDVNAGCYYWSSTSPNNGLVYDKECAWCMQISEDEYAMRVHICGENDRSWGSSVRLVCPVE